MAAVRMVLRADGVRQLLRCCDVGGQDDAVNEVDRTDSTPTMLLREAIGFKLIR